MVRLLPDGDILIYKKLMKLLLSSFTLDTLMTTGRPEDDKLQRCMRGSAQTNEESSRGAASPHVRKALAPESVAGVVVGTFYCNCGRY